MRPGMQETFSRAVWLCSTLALVRKLLSSQLAKHLRLDACRDQRLYRQGMRPSVQAPEPLTPEGELRYADGILDAGRKRIIAVQEDHSGSGEAVNSIAAVCKCQSPASHPT